MYIGALNCIVLVLQMLVISVTGIQNCHPSSLPQCGAREYTPAEYGDLLSLTCNESTIFIQYNHIAPQNHFWYFSRVQLECTSADNSSVAVYDNSLVCNAEVSTVDDTTLVLTEAGIQSGDECVVSGCYEDMELDLFLFREVSCTIPRDCEWGEWEEWSECDPMCNQNRSRIVATVSKGSGQECEGFSTEQRNCTVCPTDPPETTATSETTAAMLESTTTDTESGCNRCDRHAICLDTPTGLQCSCQPGYTGNGTLCTAHNTASEWMPPVVTTIVILVMITITVILAIAICRIFCRQNRNLDHRHLKKLMGTFDPNFTPNLSTNLKKLKAISEVSVFDVLCLPNHHIPKNDYITLEQLGIHIHANNYTRPSDMDTSSDVGMTKLEEGEGNKHCLSQAMGCSSAELNSSDGSTFSLTMDMIQAKFDLKGVFYNKHASSDGSECRGSLGSEPLDFVEDGFRVDIGNVSDEENKSYFIARRRSLNSSENDPSVSIEITSSEDYLNAQDDTNDVTDMSFSYPSSECVEHYHKTKQITACASLPSLIPVSDS